VTRRDLGAMTLSRDDDKERAIDLPADAPTAVDLLIAGTKRSPSYCAQALEGGQKLAVALAFFQGLTHTELARQLGEPLGPTAADGT
jgi:hypothetical protein